MNNTKSLKTSRDFKRVYNDGKSYANKYLVMYKYENNLNYNRLGISVSKKVGNSVVRHRLTRLVRESYRLEENNIKNSYDIIIILRTGTKGKSFVEIKNALLHLLKLQKLLNYN